MSACPVERLAERQARLQRIYAALEELEVLAEPRFDNPLWGECVVIDRRMQHVEDEALAQRARSPSGAAFHIMLAIHEIQLITGQVLSPEDLDIRADRAVTYLASALSVIDFAVGLGGLVDYYVPSRFSALFPAEGSPKAEARQ